MDPKKKRAQTARSGKSQSKKTVDDKVELIKLYSRMGRATESHFAVLNTKIQERRTEATSFDPEKVLNPALRANKSPVQHEDKQEL